MDREGKYSKHRSAIDAPVTATRRTTGSYTPLVAQSDGPVHPDTPGSRTHESSSPVLIQKPTAWVFSFFVASLMGGTVWIAATLVTRGHQIDHLREQVKELMTTMEGEQGRRIELERRIVELETELEKK